MGSDNITEQDYELIMLLDNTSSSKAEPLLVPGKGCAGEHTADNKLVIPFQAGLKPSPPGLNTVNILLQF